MTSTLLAEQKKARATPYAKVLISDKLGPHARYHWTKLYDDETDDYPCAMIIVSDDSIVRFLSDSGTLRSQRITDPEDEDHWNTWSSSVDTCSSENQIALCTTGAYVWVFYIDSTDMILYVRESSDYGASFGSRTTVHTCTGYDRLEAVTAAVTSGTDLIVFFSVRDISANLACDLYRRKRTSGAWGSASGWGKTSIERCRGLSNHKTGDYNMLMGAQIDAEPYGFEAGTYLWTLQAIAYGAGVDVSADTWADPVVIERTDAGTVYAHAWPCLTYVDTFRALYTTYDAAGNYSRVASALAVHAVTFLESEWSDGAPFQAEGGPYGMVIDHRTGGDGYVYSACSNAAYRAEAAGRGTATFTTDDRLMGRMADVIPSWPMA